MKCVSDIACIEFPSTIPCSIDLIEPVTVINEQRIEGPLRLESGKTYALDFLYKVGFPAANMFHLFFYRTPEDVRDVMQNLVGVATRQIKPNPPVSYSFSPIAPLPDETGINEREGFLHIMMPETDEVYYSILAMSHP